MGCHPAGWCLGVHLPSWVPRRTTSASVRFTNGLRTVTGKKKRSRHSQVFLSFSMQSTSLLEKKHVFLRRRAAWRWQSLSIPLGPSYPLNPGSDNEFPQGPGPGVHLFSPEHERGIAFSSPPAFKIGS